MHRLFLLIVDLLLIAIATIFALLLRDNLEVSLSRFLSLLPYLALTLVVAAPVLMVSGLHRSIWRLSSMPDYLRVVFAVVAINFAAVTLGFFVLALEGIARSLPILQGILMVFALVGSRVIIRLRHARRSGARASPAATDRMSNAPENIIVVGLNKIADLYLQAVGEFATNRIRIVGLLGRSGQHAGRLVRQYEVLGTPEEAASVLRSLQVHGVHVDRIVVTTPFNRLSREARSILLEIERTSNTKLDLFAERMELAPESKRQNSRMISDERSKNGNAAFAVSAADVVGGSRRGYWRVKRLMDCAGATGLIVLALPLAAIVAVLVAIDVGLPATFWQERPGLGGRPFRLYKFRTMSAAYDAHGRRVPDQERLSVIGRFLRRTRIDELPQLYNILVGEMSFVGPRPLLSVDQSPAYAARLLVRPGLTGWAQVIGGRDISSADKAALDVWYAHNASFVLDLRILVRTVPMVLFGERVNPPAIHSAWRDLLQAGICSSTPYGDGQILGAGSGQPRTTEQAA